MRLLGLALLVGVFGVAQAPELPAATEQHGGFGLTDASGSRLIVLPKLARPELLKTALCSAGPPLPAKFDRRQVESTYNGRQNSTNFDKLAGNLFTLPTDKVDPSAICFLATDALLAGSTIWSLTKPSGPGACAERERFSQLRARRVTQCWPLARMGAGKEVLLLEFERRGTNALASIVVVDGARAMFADAPAEFKGEGESLWRVDDDGKLSPENIEVVAVLQKADSYVLATSWAGFEGRLLSLWISEGNASFTKVINDYWYQAAI